MQEAIMQAVIQAAMVAVRAIMEPDLSTEPHTRRSSQEETYRPI